ncbi:MAG: pyridoxal-phosphate dependent enzyme [bacterium]|nr:pyridoxal-phosphate dependent enzyme [bacterium]
MSPDLPSLEQIRAAARGLESVVVRTPIVPLHDYAGGSGILLKPEIHQPVTSFKIRGVFHAVASLDPMARSHGVSTVSAGNTAQALAWAARHFGVPARALMPETAPSVKIDAFRAYGGEPVLVPVDELFRYLKQHAWENEPWAFVHPWTNRDLMVGHGSLGLEVVEQVPDVRTVWIPVGGGGLIGGVGSALKAIDPRIRVVAVEPEGCPALHESLRRGRPVTVSCRTMCDGVAVPYITDEVFPLLQLIVDDVVLVSELDVRRTIRRLALENKMIVEGAAALSVAAASAATDREDPSVALVTGGSIDTATLAEILTDSSL